MHANFFASLTESRNLHVALVLRVNRDILETIVKTTLRLKYRIRCARSRNKNKYGKLPRRWGCLRFYILCNNGGNVSSGAVSWKLETELLAKNADISRNSGHKRVACEHRCFSRYVRERGLATLRDENYKKVTSLSKKITGVVII